MPDYSALPTRNSRAFTLIDLMIALSILLISVSIGIPALDTSLKKSKAKALQTTISNVLQLGRSHSLNTGKTTTVCGLNQNSQCLRENFDTIAVFIDENKNSQLDDDEQLIHTSKLSYEGVLRLGASGNSSHISFDYRGFSKQAGSFIYCVPESAMLAKRITVSMPGRIYMARANENDGMVKMVSGDNIEC